jgi:hypothetical protein
VPNSDINSFSKHPHQREIATARTYIRSMPRDETSVRLIADQWLVEQLGYQIVEEKEQLCPESSAVSGFPV